MILHINMFHLGIESWIFCQTNSTMIVIVVVQFCTHAPLGVGTLLLMSLTFDFIGFIIFRVLICWSCWLCPCLEVGIDLNWVFGQVRVFTWIRDFPPLADFSGPGSLFISGRILWFRVSAWLRDFLVLSDFSGFCQNPGLHYFPSFCISAKSVFPRILGFLKFRLGLGFLDLSETSFRALMVEVPWLRQV